MSSTPFHSRLWLSAISSWSNSLQEDLALWADIGVDQVGLITPKFDAGGWESSQRDILEAGLQVSCIGGYPNDLPKAIDFARAVGAPLVYSPPSGGGRVIYEEAAFKYGEDIAPVVARARQIGVRVAMENTNPLQSFVYTVRDALDLGRATGVDIVLDFNSAYYERDLAKLVRENVDILALVQICDRKLGTTTLTDRLAIGDGDLPVERLLAMVLDAGYDGAFELELLGPQIASEGYRAPILRSLERASEMLERLGV
jgi:sugar phosphate isomerase/epimerase